MLMWNERWDLISQVGREGHQSNLVTKSNHRVFFNAFTSEAVLEQKELSIDIELFGCSEQIHGFYLIISMYYL